MAYVKAGPSDAAWLPIQFSAGSFGPVALSGAIAPGAIAGIHSNYSPAGINAVTTLKQGVSGAGASLTGLNTSQNDRLVYTHLKPWPRRTDSRAR